MNNLHGITLNRWCPTLSHLFFADDAIFFLDGKIQECQNLANILNQYCLAMRKQAWRLLQNPSSLWSQLFKGLYHHSTKFWHANKGLRPSWGWLSLLSGRDSIMHNLQWSGVNFYNGLIIHQVELQHHLGPRTPCPSGSKRHQNGEELMHKEASCQCRGILDKIMFFIGDLEVASTDENVVGC
ncbi:hypothetical protein ACJRO7_034376 [Eucalyptus globulus]|uniref:Uncharacterized protein n=1 Tax=Eucalyptus globulus TaxID=34317 RepID=A0ABD3J7C0_EUCGL